MRTFWMVVVVLSAALSGGLSAYGQRRGQQLPLENLQTNATIKAVFPRMLQVLADDGKQWVISLPTNVENIEFRANATPDWLRPGMLIRFNATVAIEKHKREITLKDPIKELTVVTFRPNVGMGISPENEFMQPNDLFAGGKGEAKKKRAASESVETPCLIIGRVTENKEGKLRIAAGGMPVRAELSPDAEVSVELNDVMWVRPDDKAEITARYLPGREGQAVGQRIIITAAKPLSGKDSTEKASRRSGRGRRGEAAAQEKEKGSEKEKDQEKDQEKDKGKDREKGKDKVGND